MAAWAFSDMLLCAAQYYAFVEEKQKVHCLNTLFSKVRIHIRLWCPRLFPSGSSLITLHLFVYRACSQHASVLHRQLSASMAVQVIESQ